MSQLDVISKEILTLLSKQYFEDPKTKLSFSIYDVPKEHQGVINAFLDGLINEGFIEDYKQSITGNFTVTITKQCVLYFMTLN